MRSKLLRFSSAVLSTAIFSSACMSILAASSASAQTVGISAAVNQAARGTRPNAAVRTIVLGDNVVYNERIETDGVGLLQILLADGTTFTVGPNSGLSIDRFVYDPAAGTAEVSASLTKGVFRFIGGKASKTPGGVQLNTPVGTIGIRGGMMDGRIGGSGSHFDLKFGKELTLDNPDGTQQRVYKPGFSIIITQNADGSQTRKVTRTPPGYANEIQAALSGEAGKTGGSSNPPSDRDVVDSRIATENSDRTVFVNQPTVVAVVGPERSSSNSADQTTQTGSNDIGRQAVVEQAPLPVAVPIPTTRPSPTIIRASVLTAGTTYEFSFGGTVNNPGTVGLVGGSDTTDVTADLSQDQGSAFASGTTPQGTLTLPLYNDGSFTIRNITFADGASLGGVPLSGRVYSGPEDFAAYALAIDGDRTNPVYALKGTATADLSNFLNGDVRTYAFTSDFLQELPVPFMRADAVNADYASAANTPFYVAEQNGVTSGTSSRIFQSWLVIDGQGAAQKSAVGLSVGRFFEDDDGRYQLSQSRRGSYREDSASAPFSFTGGVASLGAPDGATDLFGSNAQTMVLGYDVAINDGFGDANALRGGGSDFGTFHVLSLTNETSIDQFAAATGATRDLGTPSNSTMNGFASAVIEGRNTFNQAFIFGGTSSAEVDGLTLQFKREERIFGGELEVGNTVTRTRIAFGDGINGNTANGNSTFINDDIYGAIQNRSLTRNRIQDYDSNGNVAVTFPIVADDTAKTYFVSGDAVPQPNLLPQGKMCDCAFLEWGWWGTQIRAQDPFSGSPDENLRHGVHLGNWVAGRVTTSTDYNDFAGSTSLTTATYQGHALGTVVTNSGGNLGRYVAAGDMSMNWNFGSATGTMAITNFDGRDFASSNLAATNLGGSATFGGTLNQTNLAADASGGIDGAFVNGADIAQGVIGNMSLTSTNSDWSAVGIIAGSRP